MKTEGCLCKVNACLCQRLQSHSNFEHILRQGIVEDTKINKLSSAIKLLAIYDERLNIFSNKNSKRIC